MFDKKKHSREYHQKIRAAALAFLGGKCVRCGFSDSRALQIDHVEGNGCKIRRKTWAAQVNYLVLRGESGYQLLCANCNWIKRAENGEIGGR